ncbi:MAG: endonuclease domain-containing protein [Paraburkholderia tropica]|uniref:endonuclease domain-containing protein n=1 Tax=Paraburkholderia tropica TaxID=92647 RepID=UPI0031010C19
MKARQSFNVDEALPNCEVDPEAAIAELMAELDVKANASKPERKMTGLRGDTEARRALRETRAKLSQMRCPVCGGPPAALDHCHETGQTRSVLCKPCNGAEGHVAKGDTKAAISYRIKYGRMTVDWLDKMEEYRRFWKRPCEVLGGIMDRYGALDATPAQAIPDGMAREVLDAVVKLSEELPGTPIKGFSRAWSAAWEEIYVKLGRKFCWKQGAIAVSMLMLAIERGAKLRLVDKTEADEAAVSWDRPETQEYVRSGLPLIAVRFG